MATSVITTDLFLALIVLTSIILILILVYCLIRFINRHKAPTCHHLHQQHPDTVLDVENGRQSRQQIQQEYVEDLQRRYSSVPPSPCMQLLPEIKTSESSDGRASEWLERGKVEQGGDLEEKKAKTGQVVGVKQERQLRWDWRDGKMEVGDGKPRVIEKTDEDGMVCKVYDAEKPVGGGS
jgi:hypothetical protein